MPRALAQLAAPTAAEEGLEYGLQQLVAAHLDPAQGHQVDSLDGFRPLHALRQLHHRVGRDFAEVVRPSTRHEKGDVTDLEVRVALQDARADLEVGHQERVHQGLVVDLVALRVLEVRHHRLFNHEQEHAVEFVYAGAERQLAC